MILNTKAPRRLFKSRKKTVAAGTVTDPITEITREDYRKVTRKRAKGYCWIEKYYIDPDTQEVKTIHLIPKERNYYRKWS